MIRFLRLFSAFRALEADRDSQVLVLREALQEETTQKLILQDRLDNVLADRSALWEMTREAINEERNTLKMMANFRVQSTYGITPYPEATQLPPSLEPDLDTDHTVRRRMMPSEAIAAQTRKLRDQVVDRLMPKATA